MSQKEEQENSYAAKKNSEKEAQHEANKKTAKVAAKTAANYFTGGQGGALVDKLADTKAGDAILNKGADMLDKVPGVSKVTKKLDDSGAVDAVDKANDVVSMTSGGGAAAEGAQAASSLDKANKTADIASSAPGVKKS